MHSYKHSKGFGQSSVNGDNFNSFTSMLKEVASKFSSPLITIDIVENMRGEWRIVEVGNGRVSESKDKLFSEFFTFDETFE